MLNLDELDASILLFRGQYATVRGAHEDAKGDLAKLTGDLASVASKVLKRMQPNEDAIPESVEDLIAHGRDLITKIEQCTAEIESLAKQRAELKPLAWPR